MSYYDNKKNKISPRQQAEKISKGETKEHHIGKKSNASLIHLCMCVSLFILLLRYSTYLILGLFLKHSLVISIYH